MSCMIPEHSQTPPQPLPPRPSTRAKTGASTFADLTTMGVGGSIASLVEAHTEDEFVGAIREADASGTPLVVLGGGSNILASDEAFDGVVVRDMRSEITLTQEGGCEGANLRVLAGTPWDDFVVHTIENEWMGLEFLSGIPGSVGAAPVQNIGAYGQEVATSIARVRTWDREKNEFHTFVMPELKFGYRTSLLKESMRAGYGASPRYIVVSVDFQLRIASLSAPIQYGQLARVLGVEPGTRVPSDEVRAAVLDLRAGKGMVLDDGDRDTYSCGSFFTNPILTDDEAARLPADAPRYGVTDESRAMLGVAAPTIDGQIKTSAAWLIDHAGFPAGYGMPGPAALSTKHCLALTNRGEATGAEIRELARRIRDGVDEAFGVKLEPEPVIIGGL
ncbi:UDP-N-acetylmuramate dehydrogenase [Arcanobacterium haemolyticum]|nr:UDP-N-acetylmuramate dehydrogenase [Arcanobacterium haemolyticum]